MKKIRFFQKGDFTSSLNPNYITSNTLSKHLPISYKCDNNNNEDEPDWGSVEPCESVNDTEEPSCGIAIEDKDGEWIQLKGVYKIPKMNLFLQKNYSYKMQDIEEESIKDTHETEPTIPETTTNTKETKMRIIIPNYLIHVNNNLPVKIR
jgi:hypothetical protein